MCKYSGRRISLSILTLLLYLMDLYEWFSIVPLTSCCPFQVVEASERTSLSEVPSPSRTKLRKLSILEPRSRPLRRSSAARTALTSTASSTAPKSSREASAASPRALVRCLCANSVNLKQRKVSICRGEDKADGERQPITIFSSPSKAHLRLRVAVQRAHEDLISYAFGVVGDVATLQHISIYSSQFERSETHKISVSRTCHGGYPSSITLSPNSSSRSGSPITLSLSSTSITSDVTSSSLSFPR